MRKKFTGAFITLLCLLLVFGVVPAAADGSEGADPLEEAPAQDPETETDPVDDELRVLLSPVQFSYNGKEQHPSVRVKEGDRTLVEKKDYQLFFSGGCKKVGSYLAIVVLTGERKGSGSAFFRIVKAKNPTTVKAKKVTAYAKKKTVIKAEKAFSVKKHQGTLSFKQMTKNKKIKVSKAGKVTVQKGLEKGKTYKIKVKVSAAQTDHYLAMKAKTVTLKIRIK